jgi:very-short-patch-repair endonuclease
MNTIAKTLRKRPTDTEKVLWRHLRAKQMEGHKFSGQFEALEEKKKVRKAS